MMTLKPILTFIGVVAYLSIPVLSGAWFYDHISCVYMWSSAIKQGCSISAYLGIGLFAWKTIRPDVVTMDGALAGYLSAALLGLITFGNVIHKCW